jgi:hypothetical protein
MAPPLEITPENVLSQQHLDWLHHPVTIQMFKNLDKHRNTFIKTLSAGAGNSSEPENMFRVHSYGIRTMDAVISMLKDSNKFVEQSAKQ